MAAHNNLTSAKRLKNDEFYTMYEDIEKELMHYEDQLKDKTILCNCLDVVMTLEERESGTIAYCNCDHVSHSNFIEFLCRKAPYWNIRKVYGTYYEEGATEVFYITFEYHGNPDNYCEDDWVNYLTKTPIPGDGSFDSPACIELLKKSDVVITNPPFSLFRKYIATLEKYNKKYLIIGSMNAISYKEIFPLIKDNKLWLGYNTIKRFKQPDGTIKTFGNILWYTNIDISKRGEPLKLVKQYAGHEDKYPKYDNYDAIEVNKTKDIPYDYDGIMGVPITWLDKYCPEQFEIIGGPNMDIVPEGWQGMTKEFLDLYYSQGGTATLKPGNRNAVYINKNGEAIIPYARILIHRR